MADAPSFFSNKPGTYGEDLNWLSRLSGYGTLSEAATNAMSGINHRGVGNPTPYNTDNHGLTFFTRPRMNMSYDNIAMDRVLTPLLTDRKDSYQRAIRTLLDPDGAFRSTPPVVSDLVDHKSPFIALLTNNLLSLNGWPDPGVAYYESKPGVAKEAWAMVDDVARNFSSFDLQASFRNIAGDPITLLFYAWIRYAARVYDGTLMPYPEMIIDNEIDYQTRIYRLVLDPSRQWVQKVAACGASFPYSTSLGAAFNFSSDTPFAQDNAQQISVPFHCTGAEYQDPILFREFNDLVAMFNTDMGDDRRRSVMKELSKDELAYFNYYGYPHIDIRTQRLSWWVDKADYARLLQNIKSATRPAVAPDRNPQTPTVTKAPIPNVIPKKPVGS